MVGNFGFTFSQVQRYCTVHPTSQLVSPERSLIFGGKVSSVNPSGPHRKLNNLKSNRISFRQFSYTILSWLGIIITPSVGLKSSCFLMFSRPRILLSTTLCRKDDGRRQLLRFGTATLKTHPYVSAGDIFLISSLVKCVCSTSELYFIHPKPGRSRGRPHFSSPNTHVYFCVLIERSCF